MKVQVRGKFSVDADAAMQMKWIILAFTVSPFLNIHSTRVAGAGTFSVETGEVVNNAFSLLKTPNK